MTWSFAGPDGRATFEWILIDGELAIRWRRIGGHEVFDALTDPRPRRRDIASAAALDHWLARLTEAYAERILPIDTRVAERWGALSVPNPVSTVDGLLAATALEHDLTLVTRNTRHVASLGVASHRPLRRPPVVLERDHENDRDRWSRGTMPG